MAKFTLADLAPDDEEEETPTQGSGVKTTFTLEDLATRDVVTESPAEDVVDEQIIEPEPEPLPQGDPIEDPDLARTTEKNIDYAKPTSFFSDVVQLGVGAGEFIAMASTDLAGAFAGTLAVASQIMKNAPAATPTEVASRMIMGESLLGGNKGGQIIKDAPDLINYMRDTFRYEPRSAGGQALEGLIGGLFGEVAKMGEVAGDAVADAGLPPSLSMAARIAPEAIVMLAPFALKGKPVDSLAKDVMDANAKAKAAGKKATIFSKKRAAELEAAQEQLNKIKAKPQAEVTAQEAAAIPELTNKIQEIGTKLAEEKGLDYIRKADTDSVLSKVSEAELLNADLKRVQELVKEAKNPDFEYTSSSAKPIETVIDGTKTTVTSGIEELVAAKILGEKKVHVRTILPHPKPKAVEAMAKQVNEITNQARILDEQIKAGATKTIMDKVRQQYDLTGPLKARLRKLLPDKEWVPVVLRYEQMHNAGTSATLFAKDFFEPIFKQVTDREVFTRNIGGKSVVMTDRMILDEIVQSRLITQIAKRKPNHKFDGRMGSKEHQARLRNLEKELGPEEFAHINGLADNVFSTYKKLLDLRREEGLITPELYKKLETFDYAPREHLEFFDPEIAGQSGKGVRSSGVLKLQDGSYDLTQVSASQLLHDSINRTHNIIARNRVLAELDNAIRSNPNSDLAKHVKIIKKPKKPGKGGGNPGKGDAVLETTTVGKIPRGFEKVEFFNEGKKRALALDPYIASVWKTPAELSSLRVGTGALRVLTGVSPVKALAVGLNPAFPLVEIPRNAIGVGFSNGVSLSGIKLFGSKSNIGQGLFGLPLTAAQFARNMAVVAKDARQHGPYFRELANNNAFPRFLAEIGLESFKEINRPEGLAGKLLTKSGARYLNRVADAWSYPGIYAETVMRMAVARQAKLRGLTPLEQAGESLRMVNFNETGYMTARVDSFIPFFNAGFQASRAQFRGFKEAPVRTTALASSVMSLGFANYFGNWMTNPEAVANIRDEHLATGFNIVFPKSMDAIDPDGNLVHPYLHIPADGAAVLPLAMMAWTMRRFNEKREPSGLLLEALTSSTFPLLDVTGSPLADATLAIFGNYDRFRGKTLFPENVGEPYQEYYGSHEANATPGLYVEAGKWLWEQGVLQDTNLEGLASPERLRAAVNAYLPGHPLSNAFVTLEPLVDPTERELYVSNWEHLDKSPFIGRVLHLSKQGTNAWNDSDSVVGDRAAKRAAAKRSADEMAFQVARGDLNAVTASNAVMSRFPEVDIEYRETLAKRIVVSSEAQKIFLRSGKAQKVGVPNHKWWATLGSYATPQDKATAYYQTWIQAGPTGRRNMDRVLRQLSGVGMQHKLMDSDGKFYLTLQNLKRTQGTDFVPGILLDDVDYNGRE